LCGRQITDDCGAKNSRYLRPNENRDQEVGVFG
jgi:hypothetical protein